MKHISKIIVVHLVLLFVFYCSLMANTAVNIVKIISDPVLDEWKVPGKYSPLKVFDGDRSTCFAEDIDKGSFGFEIKLDKGVFIDEISVLNGFCKSKKLYNENNRLKRITFSFNFGGKEVTLERFNLLDVDKYQKFKLGKVIQADSIVIYSLGKDRYLYKGSKYDDTCISEIELYYNGSKISIDNAEKFQKNYLSSLNNRLIEAFSGHKYVFRVKPHENECYIVQFTKKGKIDIVESVFGHTLDVGNLRKNYIPFTEWKVKNQKVYMRENLSSKWKLVKYKCHVDGNLVRGIDIYHGKNNQFKVELGIADNLNKEFLRF